MPVRPGRDNVGRVKELLRTNDAVLLSRIEAMFEAEEIGYFIADHHMSVLEGSLGFLPRRVLVHELDVSRARRLLTEADLAHELAD